MLHLKPDDWKDIHEDAIRKFMDDPACRLLIIYHDPYKGFVVEHMIPPYVVEQLTYLIKQEGVKEVTTENFLKVVQYGTVKGAHIESLLRVMMGIYAPIFFENTSWPDSILCLYSLYYISVMFCVFFVFFFLIILSLTLQ